MTDTLTINPWYWGGFLVCILFFLALDLGVFHKQAHVVKFKEALSWTCLWVVLSLAFGLFLAPHLIPGWEKRETVEFITGYVIELSLSLDNVFVIALIFSYFRVPAPYQHRVLFWGILGALLMRGVMIAAGAAFIRKFSWALYLLGAFLIFTGIKMLFSGHDGVHPQKNLALRFVQKFLPTTADFHGQKFVIRERGHLMLTPLALVLLMVETTDLIFALDSIPAVFAITTQPFIVFTSNVFAILGLRSLYFVLAGAISYFRYLKVGLAFVLVFIGVKMLLAPSGPEPLWFQVHISSNVSLMVVAGIIAISMALSALSKWREKQTRRNRPES